MNVVSTAVLVGALAVIYLLYGALVTLFTLGVSLYIFFYSGIGRLKNAQCSVELDEEKLPGQTKIRRNITSKDILVSEPAPGVATLFDVFQSAAKKHPKEKCFGTRPIGKDGEAGDYVWENFETVDTRAKNFGSGLLEIGVVPHERVGFYSENRAEWMIGALGCDCYSLVTVSIYDTLGEENREFIVSQSQIVSIITKRAHFGNILSLAPKCPKLKHVVIFEEPTEEEIGKAKEAGIKTLHSFKAIEQLGSKNKHDFVPPKADDLSILMYTSGTTSQPKGVLISHKNMVSTVAGIDGIIPPVAPGDIYLSYLPLAHILERIAVTSMLYHGAAIGFFQGNIRKLDADIVALKPTLFAGVPKVFQRIMNNIQAKVAAQGAVTKLIFNLAFSLKRLCVAHGIPTGLLDKKIFAKVREGLGGRVQFMLGGGAPFGADCHEFMRLCFGCHVLQGYGLTETNGGCVITPFTMVEPYRRGGAPLKCCEIKLVDAGNYSTSNNPPQGEVCISGNNVSQGYYEMPEKSKEDFRKEADGRTWFHTGDVGQWNEDGSLSIIGRTKDIFKLDGGEYVAPERLEGIFSQSHYISNVFVYGESTKAYLIGIVVPEVSAALKWAEQNKVDVPDRESTRAPNCPPSLCKNEAFRKAILADLRSVAVKSKLNRFEELINIHLDSVMWTPDTGLVTDALKNKRPVLSKHYAKELQEMYEIALPATPS